MTLADEITRDIAISCGHADHNTVEEVIRRLKDAGISEITIRNALRTARKT